MTYIFASIDFLPEFLGRLILLTPEELDGLCGVGVVEWVLWSGRPARLYSR